MERRYARFFGSLNIIFFVGLACLFLACSRHATPDIPPAAIDHDGTEILSIEGHFQVSGIYPHLTTYSHGRVDGRQSYAGWAGRRGPEYGGQRECGIGAIVPWGGRLYMINYAAHEPEGSDHKLYIIDQDHRMEVFQGSVGGTPAGRMIHLESNQLFIGHSAYWVAPALYHRLCLVEREGGDLVQRDQRAGQPLCRPATVESVVWQL